MAKEEAEEETKAEAAEGESDETSKLSACPRLIL